MAKKRNYTKYIAVGIVALIASFFGYAQYSGALDITKIGDALAGLGGNAEETEETEQTIGGTKTVEKTTIIEKTNTGTTVPNTDSVPVDTLNAKVLNKYTMAGIGDVEIEFWKEGADVSDPNQAPVDQLVTVTGGVGNTTNGLIQTNKDYDVWFNGSTTYYDEELSGMDINYNTRTGKGSLMVKGDSFYPAVPFGAFADLEPVAEAEGSGVWNQTVHEAQNATCTEEKDDFIAYDESSGGGSAWFKLDLGNSNANSEIWQYALCFKDGDGDMEGDELTSLTASYVSGSRNVVLPGSLLGYWKDGMGAGGLKCIQASNKLSSAEKARYQFDMTISEANFAGLSATHDATDPCDLGASNYTTLNPEEFEIAEDDLGSYGAKQYPSMSQKATAEILSITTRV